MKKYSVIIMSAALVASSCTTGAGAGAYAGSSFGSVLGSAIGGIVGGPRGSDVGTIVGMAGGAAMGAAIGNAADKQQHQDQSDDLARRNQRYSAKRLSAIGRITIRIHSPTIHICRILIMVSLQVDPLLLFTNSLTAIISNRPTILTLHRWLTAPILATIVST